MSRGAVVLGIDVGTTTLKAVAVDGSGVVVASASAPNTWDVDAHGNVQIDMDVLADRAIAVLADAAAQSGAPVAGIGIAGLAETGVVLDGAGHPLTPGFAWYDQRGAAELAALPEGFRAEFSAVTGLAAKAECSFAKLLWLRANDAVSLPGTTWLNALEYIAYRLCGAMATEPSLASRTGLLDQAGIAPWPGALERIGADAAFLPALVPAGTSIGVVGADGPVGLRGAAVTVAGHDHLVNSVGAGATGGDDLFDSCGTADVILRTVPRVLSNDERAVLVGRGLSAGRHVLAGSTAILGASRSGLVLGRILSMLGAFSRDERQRIADTWQADSARSSIVEVSEPPGWTNEVTVRLRDDASPQEVWAAGMHYVLDQTEDLLAAIADIAGPYEHAVAAGGWAHVRGVLRGKAQLMPGLTLSEQEQAGAFGAARFAAHAAGVEIGAATLSLPITVQHHPTKEFV